MCGKARDYSKCPKNIVMDVFPLASEINKKAVRCNRVGTNLLVALGRSDLR